MKDMKYNGKVVYDNIEKRPELIKCLGIERIVASEEVNAMKRILDITKMEKRWIIESVAKCLVENKLVRFETEECDDGYIKISGMMLAISPDAFGNTKKKQ